MDTRPRVKIFASKYIYYAYKNVFRKSVFFQITSNRHTSANISRRSIYTYNMPVGLRLFVVTHIHARVQCTILCCVVTIRLCWRQRIAITNKTSSPSYLSKYNIYAVPNETNRLNRHNNIINDVVVILCIRYYVSVLYRKQNEVISTA